MAYAGRDGRPSHLRVRGTGWHVDFVECEAPGVLCPVRVATSVPEWAREMTEWASSGEFALTVAGGALGAIGVGTVSVTGNGLVTSGHLAMSEMAWNSEMGLTTSAASSAFP